MDYRLVCTSCRAEYKKSSSAFRCRKCNSILEVSYDYGTAMLKGFRKQRESYIKYLTFYPIDKLKARREGCTELARSKAGWKGTNVYFKIETQNPSRSFKDRGSAIEISKAAELGFRSVCCASTGNMGLSVAMYARKHKFRCTIFISRGANRTKLRRIREHGARIVKVRGDFNKALLLAENFAKRSGAFLCGDYHYRKEGQKSMMFEVLDQLKFRVPDYVFIQVGNGTLLSASYKAMLEFKRFGFIKKLPKIIAVQSQECEPLVKAFDEKIGIKYTRPRTYADAIAVGYPTFGLECIKALNETHGVAISVKDNEIEKARKLLLKKEGIGSEPGGAVGYAGFLKLYGDDSDIFRGRSVVIMITGNNE